MKKKYIFIGLVLLLVIFAGAFGVQQLTKRTPNIEGCVLFTREDIVTIYVASDPEWGGLWTVHAADKKFISHDSSVGTAGELQPGMMVELLCPEQIVQAISPAALEDVEYMETWGAYDEALYQEGIQAYQG